MGSRRMIMYYVRVWWNGGDEPNSREMWGCTHQQCNDVCSMLQELGFSALVDCDRMWITGLGGY